MTPRRLLLATQNKGKLQEIKLLLSDLPFRIVDLTSFTSIRAIPETAETFAENAALKASGYAKQTGLLTLADDSGLQVDALNGAPGVFSARYGHKGATDFERTQKLLFELAHVPRDERQARFVSAVAIADESGRVINLSQGTCEGRIAMKASGSGGFGYDPVFIPNGFEQTFGELGPDTKNAISHRARALAEVRIFLRALTGASHAG